MADVLRPSQAGSTLGRRRTITRPAPGPTARPPKLSSSGTKQLIDGSDAAPESSRPVHCKLENSFRMKPSDNEKFQSWRVQKLMSEILEAKLKGVTYDHNTCQTLAKDLSAEIQRRVKDFRWQRYRVVCHVTLGQQKQQGLQVASRCVWDHSLDSHASVTYDNKSVFAVAQCYGIYFE